MITANYDYQLPLPQYWLQECNQIPLTLFGCDDIIMAFVYNICALIWIMSIIRVTMVSFDTLCSIMLSMIMKTKYLHSKHKSCSLFTRGSFMTCVIFTKRVVQCSIECTSKESVLLYFLHLQIPVPVTLSRVQCIHDTSS